MSYNIIAKTKYGWKRLTREGKPVETEIADRQGYIKEGYLCPDSTCEACPYWTVDMYGNLACYKEEYKACFKSNGA